MDLVYLEQSFNQDGTQTLDWLTDKEDHKKPGMSELIREAIKLRIGEKNDGAFILNCLEKSDWAVLEKVLLLEGMEITQIEKILLACCCLKDKEKGEYFYRTILQYYVNKIDGDYEPSETLEAATGNLARVKMLDLKNLVGFDQQGLSPAFGAILANQEEMLQFIFKAVDAYYQNEGFDWNSYKTREGKTLLSLAFETGNCIDLVRKHNITDFGIIELPNNVTIATVKKNDFKDIYKNLTVNWEIAPKHLTDLDGTYWEFCGIPDAVDIYRKTTLLFHERLNLPYTYFDLPLLEIDQYRGLIGRFNAFVNGPMKHDYFCVFNESSSSFFERMRSYLAAYLVFCAPLGDDEIYLNNGIRFYPSALVILVFLCSFRESYFSLSLLKRVVEKNIGVNSNPLFYCLASENKLEENLEKFMDFGLLEGYIDGLFRCKEIVRAILPSLFQIEFLQKIKVMSVALLANAIFDDHPNVDTFETEEEVMLFTRLSEVLLEDAPLEYNFDHARLGAIAYYHSEYLINPGRTNVYREKTLSCLAERLTRFRDKMSSLSSLRLIHLVKHNYVCKQTFLLVAKIAMLHGKRPSKKIKLDVSDLKSIINELEPFEFMLNKPLSKRIRNIHIHFLEKLLADSEVQSTHQGNDFLFNEFAALEDGIINDQGTIKSPRSQILFVRLYKHVLLNIDDATKFMDLTDFTEDELNLTKNDPILIADLIFVSLVAACLNKTKIAEQLLITAKKMAGGCDIGGFETRLNIFAQLSFSLSLVYKMQDDLPLAITYLKEGKEAVGKIVGPNKIDEVTMIMYKNHLDLP